MAKNRYLPFGYRIADGEVVLYDAEAECIRSMFSQYERGGSFADIAKQMQKAGICYHEGCEAWNKQMVKRILENRKYYGENDFPPVISLDLFENIQRIRESKVNPSFKKKQTINKQPPIQVMSAKTIPDISIIKKENHLNGELNRAADDAEHLREKIFELAKQKYESCLRATSQA